MHVTCEVLARRSPHPPQMPLCGKRTCLDQGLIRSPRSASDQDADGSQGLRPGTVVHPHAALVPVHQPGPVQHLQVMADRRLGQLERVVQVADACLAADMRGDQGHQPQPHRIGQRLHQWRNLLSLLHRQGLRGQRGAAGSGVRRGQQGQILRHAPILTAINVLWQALEQQDIDRLQYLALRRQPVSRVQLAINVDDLSESIDLYSRLFGTEPAKLRPGYANFAIAEPPLKLILLENPGQGGSLNHLGVEVADTEAVDAEQTRLAEAGLASIDERDTTCCYARQDKFWVTGAPNGERWEIYTVKEDSPTFWGKDGGQSW